MAVLIVARASLYAALGTNAVQTAGACWGCWLVSYSPLVITLAKVAVLGLIRTSGGDFGLSRTLLARAGPCRGAARLTAHFQTRLRPFPGPRLTLSG